MWSLAVADLTVCMVLVVCWWGGLEECRRLWDFELGKWLNTVKGTWPFSRSLEKKTMLGAVWTTEAQLRKF